MPWHAEACRFMAMKRPPLNGEVIREARLAKGMTQEEVQDECARRGRRVYNISRMENGEIKWPTPRILPVLAGVLDLQVGELFASAPVKEKAA